MEPPPPPKKKTETKSAVEWVVTENELVTHNGFFKGVDTDNDGLVSGINPRTLQALALILFLGPEVMGIFLSSKLSKEDLATIWYIDLPL